MIIPSNRLMKGRGALTNPDSRFDSLRYEAVTDGWEVASEKGERFPLKTTLHVDASRTIISWNDSPDLPFDRSINPYRGCEHGCIYCYARPSHAYLGFSPGLDFESQLFYKPNAPELLRAELGNPRYVCKSIVIGSNTDPYQPVERKLELTRKILAVLAEFNHPVHIISKSDLILRDIDLLKLLAEKNLAAVCISMTTLDAGLSQKLEPRAVMPKQRLATLSQLASAGIPTMLLASPMIPGLNDHEMEALLQAAIETGTRHANYTMVRLPYELKDLFKDWLHHHVKDRAERVLQLIRECQGGRLYDATPGVRMRGSGIYADLLRQRFEKATQRLGFSSQRYKLDTSQFRSSTVAFAQLSLLV